MAVYFISMMKSGNGLNDKIKETYPDNHFKITDTQWLISDKSKTTQEITELLGIGDGKFQEVVVFKLSSAFFGWHSTNLWEWINIHMMED